MAELSKLPDSWNNRPDSMLGESQSNYLTSPRRKMRSSWIDGAEPTDQTAEVTKPNSEKQEMHANASKETDDDKSHDEASTATTASADSVTERAELYHSPVAVSKDKVVMQRTDIMDVMTERPESWLGGEGEEAQPYSYLQSPKTKLRASWTKPDPSNDGTKPDKGHQIETAHHRVTSPGVMKKLSELRSKSDENHKYNESLEVHHNNATTVKKPAVATSTGRSKSDGDDIEVEQKSSSSPYGSGEKISLQRKDAPFMAERPTTWMGGEGEAAELSYLQPPKTTKMRASWLQKNDDVDSMSASMPSQSDVSSQRRQTPFLVKARLSALDKKNMENHDKNEELVVEKHGHEPTLQKRVPKQEAKKPLDGKEHNDSGLHLQRASYMAERPDDWLGGRRGETAEELSYINHPAGRAKLRSSWIHTSAKGSQSMRNVYSKPESMVSPDNDDAANQEKEKYTPFYVKTRLAALDKKNFENHDKNEELVVHKHGHAPTFHKHTPKIEEEETLEETDPGTFSFHSNTKVDVQRAGYMAARPDDWLGGRQGETADELNYISHPKQTKLRTSWLHTSAKGSQSMRNVYSEPASMVSGGNTTSSSQMNATDSGVASSSRRLAGSKVMEKLKAFTALTEENHQRNEELNSSSHH